MSRDILINTLVVVAGMVFLLSSNVWAILCVADVNCDKKVDLSDLVRMKEEFLSTNCDPCPPPAPVEKTGQTTSYATGDDGDLEKGVAWPNPRFTDNLDGTVTDGLTGLIWLKNANCFFSRSWNNALSDSNGLASGMCGLTDGSSAGDWRLPNYKELFSLIDADNYNPPLPTGHPFNNVQGYYYWSSTTFTYDSENAWVVDMSHGFVDYRSKPSDSSVWPVRGPE